MFQGVVSSFPTGARFSAGHWEVGIAGIPVALFNAALLVTPGTSSQVIESLGSFRDELDRRGLPGLAIAPESWVSGDAETFESAGLVKVNELRWMGRQLTDSDRNQESSRVVDDEAGSYAVSAVNAAAHDMPIDGNLIPYLWNERRIARILDQDQETVCGGAIFIEEDLAYVGWMATLPEFQKRGYGAKVLSDLLSTARKRGADRVSLHSTSEGEPLYRRFGFVSGENFWVFFCPPR